MWSAMAIEAKGLTGTPDLCSPMRDKQSGWSLPFPAGIQTSVGTWYLE